MGVRADGDVVATTENGTRKPRASHRVSLPRDEAQRQVDVLQAAEEFLVTHRFRADAAVAADALVERLGFRRFRLVEEMKRGEPCPAPAPQTPGVVQGGTTR